MIYFTDAEIDQLISDDAPLGDLTTQSLDIGQQAATMDYIAREALTVAGTEEVVRMALKLGVEVKGSVSSGCHVKEGETILVAEGSAQALHQLWRAGLTMLEFSSAIATRTAALCESIRGVSNPPVVAGTRKHPPYLKKVALKALIVGGGTPHRFGLSESILIFEEHLRFLPDPESGIRELKQQQKEKKIVVEVHNREDAVRMTKAGADGVQIDKMPAAEFRETTAVCREINPGVVMIAAGGLNPDNALEYANAGADVLVTSWMYFGKPANIGVRLLPQ